MSLISSVDKQLEPLYKNAPKLPEQTRKSVANAWPILALVFGIIQLLAALGLWRLISVSNDLYNYANTISRVYGGRSVGLSSFDKTLIYLGVVALVVDGVILLMAYPKLKAKLRSGWDLLFLGALVNTAYAVLAIFIDGRGLGSFVLNIIGSAVVFWLLYQVKEQFKGAVK